MRQEERVTLQNERLSWRRSMRMKYGNTWTKRNASNMRSDGQRRMN